MIELDWYDIYIPSGAAASEGGTQIIDYLYGILSQSNLIENIAYTEQQPEWVDIDNTQFEYLYGIIFEFKLFKYNLYVQKILSNNYITIQIAIQNFEEQKNSQCLSRLLYETRHYQFQIAIHNDYFYMSFYKDNSNERRCLTAKVDETVNSLDTNVYCFMLSGNSGIIYNKPFNSETYLDFNLGLICEQAMFSSYTQYIYKFNYNSLTNFYNNKAEIYKIYTASDNLGIRGRISRLIFIQGVSTTTGQIYSVNGVQYLAIGGFRFYNSNYSNYNLLLRL